MNKLLLGLTAVFALSTAVPAVSHANDDEKTDAKPAKKKAKKAKKGNGEEKKAEKAE